MITNALLQLVYLILFAATTPLRAFSNVVLPANLTTAITTASSYVAGLNEFIPVSTIVAVIVAVVAIEAMVFAYKAIMWFLKRFPTQS